VWAVSASLKPDYQVFTMPVQWIPAQFQPENYVIPFQEKPMFLYFGNSIFITVVATFGNVFLAALAGFGFAKYHFWGRRALFLFVLSTFMLPIQVIMVPLFIIVRTFGWLNTYQGLIIPIMGSAFSVFFMRQFMLSIPDDYIEAARIDGASELVVFFRIVLPLSWSAVASIGVLNAIFYWDEFLWPLLVATKDDMKTLPLGLASFESVYRSSYNQLMAMSILAMLPILVAFLLAQRQFMKSIALTGMK
jgi:multiple sugar transport system permease protein